MAAILREWTLRRPLFLPQYQHESLPWPYTAFLQQAETFDVSHQERGPRLRSTTTKLRRDHQSVGSLVQKIYEAVPPSLRQRSSIKLFCLNLGARTTKCGRLLLRGVWPPQAPRTIGLVPGADPQNQPGFLAVALLPLRVLQRQRCRSQGGHYSNGNARGKRTQSYTRFP